MEIRVENVRKTFRSSEGELVTALDGINLDVPDGTVTTLPGPSGCGKTTLLRCIAGLETPDSGTIRIGDTVVWSSEGRRTVSVTPDRRGIGMVFQTYAIWPHMSVAENVAYPLESQKLRKSEIRERVERALEFVQLAGYGRRPATALSGGQQQRVSLARAIVAEPRVILFDEPLSNLDAKLREETRAELRELLTRLAISSLYVTHDRFEALALSDDVVAMQGGSVQQRGTPEEVYFRSGSRFVVDFMGKANFIPAKVTGRATTDGKPDPSGPRLRCETPLGPLVCEPADEAGAGEQGTVTVRMEFIDLLPVPSDGAAPGLNGTGGRATDRPVLGGDRGLTVAAGEQVIHLRVPSTVRVEAGQEVRLHFRTAGCRFLKE